MPDAPKRIHLRRQKGWRLPAGAINCARPTRWGNPFRVGAPGVSWCGEMDGPGAGFFDLKDRRHGDVSLPGPHNRLTAGQAGALYRDDLMSSLADPDPYYDDLRQALEGLRGHDLACWCGLDEFCHVDVLLCLANA